mgnify:CR=1 FL=1
MTPIDATYQVNHRTLRLRRIESAGGPPRVEARLDGGAWAKTYDLPDDREATFDHAMDLALVVYGRDRQGRPRCTNSMVHEIWNAMRDIAGC